MREKTKLLNRSSNYPEKIILLILGITLTSLGTSITMNANLGQSTVSALCQNISYLSGIRAGTLIAVFNYICFAFQIIILKKDFQPFQIFQLILTSIFGVLVNFFKYDMIYLSTLSPDVYILNILMFLLGMVISAFGVALTMKADLVVLPYEGICNVVANKLDKPFGIVRQIIDLSVVIMSIAMIIIFHIPNTTVREGTIIMTLAFGKLISFFNIRLCDKPIPLKQESAV